MDKASAYNRYKKLKENLDYTYKGYNLKHLIPGYLNYIYDELTPSFKFVLIEFLNNNKIIDLREAINIKSEVLITYLISRTDYKNLADAATTIYPDSVVINLSELPLIKKTRFSHTYIKHFLKAFKIIFFRSLDVNTISKLHLMAIVIKIFNQINILEKNESPLDVKKYISFNSAFREESLLTEFFNKRNVETITLQHGIFCDFKLRIPFDYINFDNFIAQKMLCWGQSTIDYLTQQGIDKSRLILTGNLKYKDLKIENVNQNFKKCLVLLGRGLYVETNNKLLKVISDYNKKHNQDIVFYIKKHPFLRDEDHRQYADASNDIIFLGKEHSVEDILKSSLVDFSIAVNTTAYYESLALGKPCLRWVEAENEDFFGMDDKFASMEEMELKIQSMKTMDKTNIKNEMQKILKYIFNPSA